MQHTKKQILKFMSVYITSSNLKLLEF